MGFMFCDLHVSLKLPFIGDINSTSFFLGGGGGGVFFTFQLI